MRLTTFITLAAALLPGLAEAGTYGVSPLSLSYSPQTRTGVVTVTNEDDQPLSIRIKAMKWTQGDSGDDQYADTDELIFFPRRLDMKPGEKRLVRVGVKAAQESSESAYRLYLEELPAAQTDKTGATKLAVLVTFGLPVFNAPADAKAAATLGDVSATPAGLQFAVSNRGNAHERLSRITTEDGALVTEDLPGRYIFPGRTRNYSAAIPAELCDGQERELRFEAESGVMEARVRMPTSCQR